MCFAAMWHHHTRCCSVEQYIAALLKPVRLFVRERQSPLHSARPPGILLCAHLPPVGSNPRHLVGTTAVSCCIACHLSLCLCAATAVPAVRMPMQQSLCYARKAQICVRVLLLCLLLLCWSIDDDDRVSADSWLAGRLAIQPWQVSASFAGCGSGQQRCNVYTGLLAWSGSKFVAQIMLAC